MEQKNFDHLKTKHPEDDTIMCKKKTKGKLKNMTNSIELKLDNPTLKTEIYCNQLIIHPKDH